MTPEKQSIGDAKIGLKNKHCSATVITKNYGQEDKEISVGYGKHSHPPITGLLQDTMVRSQVSMTPEVMLTCDRTIVTVP